MVADGALTGPDHRVSQAVAQGEAVVLRVEQLPKLTEVVGHEGGTRVQILDEHAGNRRGTRGITGRFYTGCRAIDRRTSCNLV
jgi:hypothetical protein